MNLSNYANQIYFDNTLQDYAVAFLIILSALFCAKILKIILETRLEKYVQSTSNKVDDLIVDIILKPFVFLITVIGVYFAIFYLNIPIGIAKWLKIILQILIAFKIAGSVSRILAILLDYYFDQNNNLKTNTNLRYIAKKTITIVLWILVIILIVTNLGYNLNSVLAGLGIGGIALALAVQNILGDLFGSISIFLDRPFQIGDFIVIGDKKGTVKSIGMKTTRITTLQGEELVIPNATLTSTDIQNFRKMKERRVVFQIGVLYETPVAKIKKIPKIIEEIISKKEKCRFDRAHFALFGEFSLIFEIVYFVNSGEYMDYMNIQQAVNLELMEQFAKDKIEFAYPTQKVFVAK